MSSIDFESRMLLVMGKGSKERWMPFGEAAARMLYDYLEAWSEVTQDGDSPVGGPPGFPP